MSVLCARSNEKIAANTTITTSRRCVIRAQPPVPQRCQTLERPHQVACVSPARRAERAGRLLRRRNGRDARLHWITRFAIPKRTRRAVAPMSSDPQPRRARGGGTRHLSARVPRQQDSKAPDSEFSICFTPASPSGGGGVYQRFYELADEPFRLTPDPRYLFLSRQHAEALAHLRLGLTESSGFVCITGDVGTGKTTLLRAFLAELGPNVVAAYTHVPPISALELLRRITHAFGLPASGSSAGDLVDELHRYLIAEAEAGRVCVVILDEAQALAPELLEQIRLLLNLETPTRKLLRIVLVGQPQLRRLLLDPELAQWNQRITLRWHLGPLSRREVAAYVAHRVAIATGAADRPQPLFTRPALSLLHSVSQGVPRIVNMIAHRALLAAFLARHPRVSRRFVALAYREIQAVPLPGTLSPARKVAWAVAGLATGCALAVVAATRLTPLLEGVFEPKHTISRSEDGGAPARLAMAAEAARQVAAQPMPAAEVALEKVPVPSAPPIVSATELTRRLASIDPAKSPHAATNSVLALWRERPLAETETPPAAQLELVAWQRGLHELHVKSNLSMLRLLDLPAVVVLRVPTSSAPRYAAFTAMDGSRVVLSIAGQPVTVDADDFEQLWTGEAHVFWRDFEALGPPLGMGARGIAVIRLQELLRSAGVSDKNPSGAFDADTDEVVRRFQRTQHLLVDGRVGPFTRILLYTAAGRSDRPSLVITPQAAS